MMIKHAWQPGPESRNTFTKIRNSNMPDEKDKHIKHKVRYHFESDARNSQVAKKRREVPSVERRASDSTNTMNQKTGGYNKKGNIAKGGSKDKLGFR